MKHYDNSVTITIPVWGLELLNRSGFMDRYLFHTSTAASYREAYQLTESEHVRFFGRQRYTDYDRFRSCKSTWQKKQSPGTNRRKRRRINAAAR